MKLNHVAINVSNIQDSIEWYCSNLHAEVEYRDDTWAMLKVADTSIALTVAQEHPPHIGFEVENFCDLANGSEIKQHRDGSYYRYEPDPDGNIIEKIYRIRTAK